MSTDQLDISRRKLLAGLGTAGVAAAGAGLGTTAYLNDTESFTDNQLVAGTLDLKVDWQQSYYGPDGLVPVNAYPDHDGDGLQSIDDDTEYHLAEPGGQNEPIFLSCANLESGDRLPEGVYASPDRADADGGPIAEQGSLVALDDVKPGDWGEITFSLHLCDNPGYVWLTADGFEQSGGVTTEPEEAELDGASDDGELAENTFVEIWYDDDCDNILDREGEESTPVCVELVLDASGSMANENKNANTIAGASDLAEAILDANSDNMVGVTFFSADGYDEDAQNQLSVADSGASDVTTVLDTIDDLPADGDATAIGAGIREGEEDLANCPEGHDRIMIVLSNGAENVEPDADVVQDARDAEDNTDVRLITIGIGTGNATLLENIATDPAAENAYTGTTPANIEAVFESISQVVLSGEQVILGVGDGEHDEPVTLAEAMAIIENNDGMVPLDGNGDMGYDDGATSDARDCFDAGTQHCIGVRWWVPEEVGNVIQGDTVEFDLGFYAEQCRHNDGSGVEMEA